MSTKTSTPVGAAEEMVLDALYRAPGSRAWMAEVCRSAALSLAAHGVRNDQLSKVADWLTQQPSLSAPVRLSSEDRAVLMRLKDALPNVGLKGWIYGVRVLERILAQWPTEDADAVSAGGWYQGGDRTCGPNATTFRFIRDDNGIVAFVEGSRDVAMKRAARIVECVNACTGIADPAAFIRLAKQAGAAQQPAAVDEFAADRERLLRAFMMECGIIGAKEAGVNLARGIKAALAAKHKEPT